MLYVRKTGITREQLKGRTQKWQKSKNELLKRLDYRLHVKIEELTEVLFDLTVIVEYCF